MTDQTLALILETARRLVAAGTPSTEANLYAAFGGTVTHNDIIRARDCLLERGEWPRAPGQRRTRLDARVEGTARRVRPHRDHPGPCWREVADYSRAMKRIRRMACPTS